MKLLGVTLDRHMTFADHIDEVHSKYRALACVLARSASYLTVDLRRLFYTSMIRTHMEYCLAVYTGASATKLKKLDTIQKILQELFAVHQEMLMRHRCLPSSNYMSSKHDAVNT